jgi:hypothetical protein
MLITKERLNRGIRRLLDAPKDLAISGAPVWDAGVSARGSAEHRRLFLAYRGELRTVVPRALNWWQGMADEAKKEGDELDAWRTRPAGPASYPRFVALVRKYWLECYAFNKVVEAEERVPPEVFLLGWLLDVEHGESIQVLACMPYWPIGMDSSKEWC